MESDDDYEGPSRSQLKREAQAITGLGERLLEIPTEQLKQLPYPQVIEAVESCRKISRGGARKRQIQYIGKLLRTVDISPVQQLIDRFDASSRVHALKFHQLETWREQLINEHPDVMQEIIAAHPTLDRQHLRQLVRNSIRERQQGAEPPVHFRKLFQFLKSLSDAG